MPTFNIKSLLIVTAFFSLFSCEEIVELPFDVDPIIEIRSRLSESGLDAQVFLAKSATDNTPTQYIDDATVKVFKKNAFLQQLTLEMNADGLPCYKTKNWVPEYDVEYTLVVEVENFKTVTAKTIVPKPVSIEEPFFENSYSPDDGSEITKVNFDVSFNITDPAATTNYYHLSFYQQLYSYVLDEQGNPTAQENTLEYARLDIKPVDESGPAERLRSNDYLFSDERFNGQSLRLAFKGSFEYDKSKKMHGQFFVVLRTVSEDYYLSEKSKQNQPNNDDEIVNGGVFFNNTDNGVGTFTGFTTNTNIFKLQG
jgi:hypothetical protein